MAIKSSSSRRYIYETLQIDWYNYDRFTELLPKHEAAFSYGQKLTNPQNWQHSKILDEIMVSWLNSFHFNWTRSKFQAKLIFKNGQS